MDFSKIRIHADAESASANTALGSNAHAYGDDIYLGHGVKDLNSSAGRRLLAHELAHSVQQRGTGAATNQSAPALTNPSDAVEHEANQAAVRVAAGQPADIQLSSAPTIARDVADAKSRRVPLSDENAQLETEIAEGSAEFKQQYIDNNIDYVEYFSTGEAESDARLQDFKVFYKDGTTINFSLSQFVLRFAQNNSAGQRTARIAIPARSYHRVGKHIFPDVFSEGTVPRLIDIATTIAYNHRQRRQRLEIATVTFKFATILSTYVQGGKPLQGERALAADRKIPFPERRPTAGEPAQSPAGVRTHAAETPAPVRDAKAEVKTGATSSSTPAAILPDGTHLPPNHFGGGYHGTDVPPEIAMKNGLPERGNDYRLLEHAEGNPNSAFRGTTPVPSDPVNEGGAAYWAGEGGYVYKIEGVPTWDVNDALQGRVRTPGGYRGNIMRGENESAILSRVPPDKIKRWGVVKSDRRGRLFVEWHKVTP